MGIVNMQPLHLSDTTIHVMPRDGLKDRGIFEGTYPVYHLYPQVQDLQKQMGLQGFTPLLCTRNNREK